MKSKDRLKKGDFSNFIESMKPSQSDESIHSVSIEFLPSLDILLTSILYRFMNKNILLSSLSIDSHSSSSETLNIISSLSSLNLTHNEVILFYDIPIDI